MSLPINNNNNFTLTSESKWVARCANSWLNAGVSLEPSMEAENLSLKATRAFFTLASKNLDGHFPLHGFNKCLGVVALPRSKLVLLAVSQHREPVNDIPLRTNLLKLIEKVNTATKRWVFELVCVPTWSEYNTLLTLPTKNSAKVTPNRRCVEAALMVALCKIGRFHAFAPQEISVMAFGAHLWASPKEDVPVENFGGIARNKRHSSKELEIPSLGWIDIWDPCKIHCAPYQDAMRAIALSGSTQIYFSGPRSDWNPKHS